MPQPSIYARCVYIGREESRQLKKDVLEQARDQIRRNIEAKLRAVRCPDHPTVGKLSVEMRGDSGGQIKVTSGCEKVADEVRAIFGSASGSGTS